MSLQNSCPATQVFNILSKRWILLILHSLSKNIFSFNAIKKNLKGISSRTLSERLKELECFGFVERKIVSMQPVKIEYHLTSKAQSFEKILEDMSEWAKKEMN